MLHNKRGHHNKKFVHSKQSGSHLPQLEKGLRSNKDPAQPKIKTKKHFAGTEDSQFKGPEAGVYAAMFEECQEASEARS